MTELEILEEHPGLVGAAKCRPHPEGLRWLKAHYHAGHIGYDDLNRVVQAWLGHASFGDTWRLRRQLSSELIPIEAEHGRNAGRLVEQRSTERPRLEP